MASRCTALLLVWALCIATTAAQKPASYYRASELTRHCVLPGTIRDEDVALHLWLRFIPSHVVAPTRQCREREKQGNPCPPVALLKGGLLQSRTVLATLLSIQSRTKDAPDVCLQLCYPHSGVEGNSQRVPGEPTYLQHTG